MFLKRRQVQAKIKKLLKSLTILSVTSDQSKKIRILKTINLRIPIVIRIIATRTTATRIIEILTIAIRTTATRIIVTLTTEIKTMVIKIAVIGIVSLIMSLKEL